MSGPGAPAGSRRILIATTNRNKLREIRALLEDVDLDVDLIALDAWPELPAPEETGVIFEETQVR